MVWQQSKGGVGAKWRGVALVVTKVNVREPFLEVSPSDLFAKKKIPLKLPPCRIRR